MAQDPTVEVYAAYTREYGYPPRQPNHLIAFGKKNGVKIAWGVAKKLIQSKPDVSNVVPSSPEDETPSAEANSMGKMLKVEEEERVEKMETARRYSKKFYGDQRVSMEMVSKDEASKEVEVTKNKNADLVDQLTTLGWNRDMAVIALRKHSGDLGQANEWLMGNQIEDDTESAESVPSQLEPPNANTLQSPQTVDTVQSPQSPHEWSWQKLLNGHGSIKHRLKALQDIRDHLHELEVAEDNGKLILEVFAAQIVHEDYIYREYAVRKSAIATIPMVWSHCLCRCHDIPQLIEESFPGVLDSLYLLLDDNRAKAFHQMAQNCARQMIGAVVTKPRPVAVITALCGVLTEKTNLENVNQARCRLFAAQQMFEGVVFANDSEIVHDLFEIDLDDHDNGMDRFVHGVELQAGDVPKHRQYLDVIVAVEWKNNEEETLKDIIADTVGLMLVDANQDICAIGFNLTVIFMALNAKFAAHLEPEANRRFERYFVGAQQGPQVMVREQKVPLLAQESSSGRPPNGSVDRLINSFRESQKTNSNNHVWQIPQMTDLSISAPSMPDI